MRAQFLAICLIGVLGACGDSQSASEPGPTDAKSAAKAAAFFEDLPDAGTVAAQDIGDLYFKILTRVTTKIRSARNAASARNARAIIDHAREQVRILVDRSANLPETERSTLFQNSLAQLNYAKSQYRKTVQRIDPDDPDHLRALAEHADKPWPSLAH